MKTALVLLLTALMVATLSGIGFATIIQVRQIQAQAYQVFMARCVVYAADPSTCQRTMPSIGIAIQILRCREREGLDFMDCITQKASG